MVEEKQRLTEFDFTVLLSPGIEDKHFSEISHVNIMKKVYFYDSDR